MPVPDRLAELRRQRALIQEHLAWLDREIAAAAGNTAPTPANLPAPEPPGAASGASGLGSPKRTAPASDAPPLSAGPQLPTAGGPDTDHQAEAILSEYRAASSDLQRDVRKGCFLYFVGAFAVLAAVVAILWFALHR